MCKTRKFEIVRTQIMSTCAALFFPLPSHFRLFDIQRHIVSRFTTQINSTQFNSDNLSSVECFKCLETRNKNPGLMISFNILWLIFVEI